MTDDDNLIDVLAMLAGLYVAVFVVARAFRNGFHGFNHRTRDRFWEVLGGR